jgi:PmbA protein
MPLNALLSAVNEYDGLEYRIKEEKITRAESYFIKQESDMNRAADVTHTYLTVYKVFEENGKRFRGSAQTEIHPGMSAGEIKAAIDEALYAAGFVRNEYYPLAEKGGGTAAMPKSDIEAAGLYGALDKLRAALYSQDKHEKGYLSYSEFFVAKKDVRVLNSNGVDLSYTVYTADIETAVNWTDGKEIEIMTQYVTASCDPAPLENRIARLFDEAAQKPKARMTPAVKDTNILLTGECLKEFFSYYYANASAVNVYNNMSAFKVGDALQGDVLGDKISIALDPLMPGSTLSKPCDNDGFALEASEFMKDGTLLRYWGDLRHSSYLNIPPTGLIQNFRVTGGTKHIAELKAEPYLELTSFSGFQMNPITGDFASEIRLGYYFDGKETVAVTGGSISGNIKNVHGNMFMSVEQAQYNEYLGPQTICIRNAAIAGEAVS